MRGILVCVDYSDLLSITLPLNAKHFTEILVISHPSDIKTADVVGMVPNARLFTTNAFYEHGAHFNKGLAMERGFDEIRHDEWLLILDADIILPEDLKIPSQLRSDWLYGMRRRILEDPRKYSPSLNWQNCPISADRVIAGYFQLFDPRNPRLTRPWYDPTWTHAGGCDGYFQSRFGYAQKEWIRGAYCLHLGPRDTNWFGRASARLDGERTTVSPKLMDQYVTFKGWRGRNFPGAPAVEEHVDVPGYKKTGYRL